MQIILGSSSPRRREVFEFFSLPFTQVAPDFHEESVPFNGDPRTYANTLSRGKAKTLGISHTNSLIITADTIVYMDGKIYNKPQSFEDNLRMLRELNGKWHSVFTSLTGLQNEKMFTVCDETRVLFHELKEEELRAYCLKLNPLDKAGGYGIQDAGSLLVKRLEGCFYNVMGLSINALVTVLKEFEINLWHYLKPPSKS
jgi:septum formation protein